MVKVLGYNPMCFSGDQEFASSRKMTESKCWAEDNEKSFLKGKRFNPG